MNVYLSGYLREPTFDHVLDPRNVLSRLLARANLTATTCLRFIDVYGSAVFNDLQAPILAEELRGLLAADDLSSDETAMLRAVLALAERCYPEGASSLPPLPGRLATRQSELSPLPGDAVV